MAEVETNQDIKLDLASKYDGKNVLLKIQDRNVEPKVQKFRSFTFPIGGSIIYIKKQPIHLGHLFNLLKEHGLPQTIPIQITLNDPTEFISFDFNPSCYDGPKVWYFNWPVNGNQVECSITGHNGHSILYIRVHDMTPLVGETVIHDITEELYKHYVPPVKPLGMLSIYTTKLTMAGYQWVPNCSKLHRDISTIYMDAEIKDKIVTKLRNFLASSHIYDKYGRTWKRVHLFHGPPGSGKTSTVLALASLMGYNIAKLTVTPQMNSQHIETLFGSLPQMTFLLLEDVDALFIKREAAGSVDFSTLLQCMDGLTTQRGMILFMTTNHKNKLDSAFIRPGRVDLSVEFHPPGRAELAAALQTLGVEYAHEHEEFLKICPANMSIASLQEHIFNCIMEEKKSILEFGDYLEVNTPSPPALAVSSEPVSP